MSRALLLARVGLGLGRALLRQLPEGLKKNLEDRFFYAVFQSTRVTNDAYGWRPSTPPGSGEAEAEDQERST